MRGRGKFLQSTGGPSDLFDCNGDPLPCFLSWCFFNNYIIKVAFKALPWNVIDDSCVTAHASSYYLDNDNGAVAATSFNFAPLEWCRYIDVQVQTKEESLTAQQGQMKFNAFDSGSGLPMAANGAVYVGMPKLFIPNAVYTVVWKYVPLRYINSSNSYITGGGATRSDGTNTYPARPTWRGRINQNTMTIGNWIFPAGSLMYLNASWKTSTPPVQEITNYSYVGSYDGGNTVFAESYQAYDKLVDVTFTFYTTTRYLQDSEETHGVTNRSYVTSGFNIQPWFMDRQYHYAETSPNAGLLSFLIPKTPSFLSAPLELLTYDPDVPNGGV